MKIKINKEQVVNNFLNPISKLTDRCVINIQQNFIYTLTNNDDGTIILYGKIKANTNLKEKNTQLNIPDIKKLCRVFDCIDEEELDIEVNSNSLSYNSNDIKFKYHLLDSGIIENIISTDKINKLNFNCNFLLSSQKLNEILKGSVFTTDSNKIYFYVKDEKVYAELTDKALANIDSITFHITNSFKGTTIKKILPVSLEVFRMLAGLKSDNILVKINTELKVLMFEIKNNNMILKYIVSALVK